MRRVAVMGGPGWCVVFDALVGFDGFDGLDGPVEFEGAHLPSLYLCLPYRMADKRLGLRQQLPRKGWRG